MLLFRRDEENDESCPKTNMKQVVVDDSNESKR
jgi:hypothetical protein